MDKKEFLEIVMAMRRIMYCVKSDKHDEALADETFILDKIKKEVKE